MVAVFLSILKITGIVLLCVLLLLLTAVFLLLFVPVRYQIKGYRREKDDAPVRASVKVTWLLHIVNASFRYPEEAYVKIRIFCFTVFSTMKKRAKKTVPADSKKSEKKEDVSQKAAQQEKITRKEETVQEEQPIQEEKTAQKEQPVQEETMQEEKVSFTQFLKKLFDILRNIKYTINQIYDKIKHIIINIRYYIGIIESDSFQRAWKLCSNQAVMLIKSIRPRKIQGDFVIGMDDPAGTARILAVQGILYPVIGNHIIITPDFDHSIIEGDFFIKGRITVYKVLRTALKVYFNKDLRRVIRLFKKEAA